MKISAVVALLLSSASAMNLRAESLVMAAPANATASVAHKKRIDPSDLDRLDEDAERAERLRELKRGKDLPPEEIEKTLEARELEHRKRMKTLEEDLKEEVAVRKAKKEEAKGTLGKQMDLIKEEKKKVLDKVRQQEKALEEDDAVLHEEKNFLKGEQELLREEMSKVDKSAQAKDEFGEYKDSRVKFLKAKMDHNERQIKYNRDRLTENLEKQKHLEDDLYHGVHDKVPLRILDRPLVNDEKKEEAKEEEKEEAKDEEKKEERKESKLNNANKDLVTLLGKVGWWTGVWKQEVPLHPYDLPMFEGDMVTLNDDGTFTTKGTLNVADGDIWFNLVDGSLNLKRAQEPATEPGKLEGLSNDYYMTYNHHETAQVKRMQDGEEFTLRREKDEKAGDYPEHQTHLKAISDGVWKTLRSETDLTGEWRGDFWGGDLLLIHNNGRFMIDEPANIFDGEIWVNLKDHALNFKRHAIARERLTNDHYGTQDTPDHVEIVKQQNGSKKEIKKIRGFVPPEQI